MCPRRRPVAFHKGAAPVFHETVEAVSLRFPNIIHTFLRR